VRLGGGALAFAGLFAALYGAPAAAQVEKTLTVADESRNEPRPAANPNLGTTGKWMKADASGTEEPAALFGGACTPYTGIDQPHPSATGWAVSAHGWWNKGNCTKPTAKVRACLYEWYVANGNGYWHQKACNTSTLKTYTPYGQRTTVRRDCEDSATTGWRNEVDVDVIDEGDTAEKWYFENNVPCRVYS
jgi:hypothetical protein